MSTTPAPYGTGKSSGSISESMGSSGMSSGESSCDCNLSLEPFLIDDATFYVVAANSGICDITIVALNYVIGGGVGHGTSLPQTLASGDIANITAAEAFDVRGLTVEVVTSCATFYFTVPVSL